VHVGHQRDVFEGEGQPGKVQRLLGRGVEVAGLDLDRDALLRRVVNDVHGGSPLRGAAT